MIQDFSISGVVDLLAQRNRVLCFYRPGFGHSQRPRSRIWTPSTQAALFAKALKRIGARYTEAAQHLWATPCIGAKCAPQGFPRIDRTRRRPRNEAPVRPPGSSMPSNCAGCGQTLGALLRMGYA
jgi:hypothetical protein